jgi:hypothetical protein
MPLSSHVVSSVLLFVCLVGWAGAAHANDFGPFPEGTTVFVDASNLTLGDGSETNPYRLLQFAVHRADLDDRVGAAPGIYAETVILPPGKELVGSGSELSFIEPPAGQMAVQMGSGSTFAGFGVRNGTPRGSMLVADDAEDVMIRDNAFFDNEAQAISVLRSSGDIVRNLIVGNPERTGFPTFCPCDAIQVRNSGIRIAENEIDGSDPNGNVDAIRISYINSSVTESFLIERNLIIGQVSLHNINAQVELQNVIRDNLFLSRIGGISVAFSGQAGSIVNNTIVGGGGIGTGRGTIARIENNVIAFGRTGINDSGLAATIRNNNVFGNERNYAREDLTGVDGNISEDPLFLDPENLDYRLSPGSPAIDGGANDAPGVSDTDFDGNLRPVDGDADGAAVIDMGAFEAPEPLPIEGEIEIRPRSRRNVVREGSRVPLAVVLLGSEAASAALVDRDSLRFGPAGAPPRFDLTHPSIFFLSLRDVNRDGFADLVAFFDVAEAGIEFGLEEACLEWSSEGRPFRGCDAIRVLPTRSRWTKRPPRWRRWH